MTLLTPTGHSLTSDYRNELATKAVKNCENESKCKVRSFVADNAANMAKTRRNLKSESSTGILTYGCFAHILNLPSRGFELKTVREQVVHMVKYFRNSRFAGSKSKKEGGKRLNLPSEVR